MYTVEGTRSEFTIDPLTPGRCSSQERRRPLISPTSSRCSAREREECKWVHSRKPSPAPSTLKSPLPLPDGDILQPWLGLIWFDLIADWQKTCTKWISTITVRGFFLLSSSSSSLCLIMTHSSVAKCTFVMLIEGIELDWKGLWVCARRESRRVRLCIDGLPSQLLPDSPSIVRLSECILLLRALECLFSTCVMDGALFCTPLPLPPNPSFSPSAFDSFITSFYSAPIKVSDSSSAVVQIWGPLLFFIRSVSNITIQPLRHTKSDTGTEAEAGGDTPSMN